VKTGRRALSLRTSLIHQVDQGCKCGASLRFYKHAAPLEPERWVLTVQTSSSAGAGQVLSLSGQMVTDRKGV
jgi:hypothetical protein